MERRALLLRLTAPFSAQHQSREQDWNLIANNLHVACCKILNANYASWLKSAAMSSIGFIVL